MTPKLLTATRHSADSSPVSHSVPVSRFPLADQYDSMTPKTYVFGAAMLLLGAVGIYMVLARPLLHPLLTIFFYSVPANCAVSLFPHEPVLILYGKTVNLWSLSLAATLGTILATFVDYKFFSPLLNLKITASRYRDRALYQRARDWFHKRPFLTLAVVGFSPIPFAPFKFLAYSSKYSCRRYLLAVALGRFPRYYLLGLLGFAFQIPNWIVFGSFAILLIALYHRKFLALLRRLLRPRAAVPGGSNAPTGFMLRTAAHTIWNLLLRRPICVSFEITHNCTANCRHCDKGGRIDEQLIRAPSYARICRELNPALVQIAGGEPLLREDLLEIVSALRRPGRPPFLVVVTNGSLLTKERYLALRAAGVQQFSISLDFPDRRHDEFRRRPGLFAHLERVVPELLSLGHGDVVLNSCIHRANYPHLLDIARMARQWGAKLNFSAYTDLRTHNHELNLRHPTDTERLAAIIDRLYRGSERFDNIMTSERVMRRYCRFFETHFVPNCRAGQRFLVVNPDGYLTPCAMHIERRYQSRQELVTKFTRTKSCGGCYISSRANTEKRAWELLVDGLRFIRLPRGDGRGLDNAGRSPQAGS